MPKSHALGGPTYAGHVDASPDSVTPDWRPASEVAESVAVSVAESVAEPVVAFVEEPAVIAPVITPRRRYRP